MIKFVLNSLWKVFILFFSIHILSHWSEVEKIFTPCESDATNQQKCLGEHDTYRTIMRKIANFSLEAGYSSMTSLLEVVNFAIFIAKRGTFYIKSKSFYEQYKAQE